MRGNRPLAVVFFWVFGVCFGLVVLGCLCSFPPHHVVFPSPSMMTWALRPHGVRTRGKKKGRELRELGAANWGQGTWDRELGTGNWGQGTGAGNWGAGNWGQQTGDRELGTGKWGQGTGGRGLAGRELGTGNWGEGTGTGDRELGAGNWADLTIVCRASSRRSRPTGGSQTRLIPNYVEPLCTVFCFQGTPTSSIRVAQKSS